METALSKELQAMAAYVERLAAQRDEARRALERANEEVESLKSELRRKDEELKKSSLDVEFLTLSHKLADNPQSLAQARQTVKRMIVRVDKAIAMLKDDARV